MTNLKVRPFTRHLQREQGLPFGTFQAVLEDSQLIVRVAGTNIPAPTTAVGDDDLGDFAVTVQLSTPRSA